MRSTAVGDLLADHDGNLYVVESFGFQLYQPKGIDPMANLAEAYRRLETACTELTAANDRSLLPAARQALVAMQHFLVAEAHPANEMPIRWENAQPGDLVGHPEMGQFRVIARKLSPKWRAKRLLAFVPNAQIWIDSPRTWAVLVPVPAHCDV